MRRYLPAALLTLLTLSATSAAAQDAANSSRVQPGSRVRVRTVDAGTIIGRVLAVQGDTLRVTRDGAPLVISVPTSQITALDVSVGRHKRRWKGAGLGFAAGMVLGGAVGAATYKSNSCTGDFCDIYGPWPNVVAGAVLAGTAGAITGAVLGSGTADTWAPVAGAGARLGLMSSPRRGGIALGASLRF